MNWDRTAGGTAAHTTCIPKATCIQTWNEDYWRLELKVGESVGEGLCKPAEDRYYLACVLDGDKPFFEDALVIFRHNGNGRFSATYQTSADYFQGQLIGKLESYDHTMSSIASP